ncbi:hypothetical protein V2A60_004148 [Cordyceps javanica]|uniref:AAA ATPasedomain-containing protein n=1 Tax=Cordyceps javanica TaxID=43265 RepID=A0A545UW59_9HYPO|nr:AAA ATPasedomain-containing protein [Cordyceps javanica]TQW02306.1 AAA ATPase domain-containing protein [Cordyceps javanica]
MTGSRTLSDGEAGCESPPPPNRPATPKDVDNSERLEEYDDGMDLDVPTWIVNGIVCKGGPRLRGTCQWIEKEPSYVSWLEDKSPGLLYLIGGVRTGKTILTTYLVDKLRRDPSASVLSFDCINDALSHRYKEKDILELLILQLLNQNPKLVNRHAVEYAAGQGRSRRLLGDFEDLWNLFLDLIQDPEAGQIFVFIDNLEACDKISRPNLVESIEKLFQPPPSSPRQRQHDGGQKPPKFFLTCRPRSDIFYLSKVFGRSLVIEPRHTAEDVGKCLSRWLEARFETASPIRRRVLYQELQPTAGNTFLWLSCKIQWHRAAMLGLDDIKREPRALPEALNWEYNKMLAKIKDDGPAMFILRQVMGHQIFVLRELIEREFEKKFGSSSFESALLRCALVIQERRVSTNSGDCDALELCHPSIEEYVLKNHP